MAYQVYGHIRLVNAEKEVFLHSADRLSEFSNAFFRHSHRTRPTPIGKGQLPHVYVQYWTGDFSFDDHNQQYTLVQH